MISLRGYLTLLFTLAISFPALPQYDTIVYTMQTISRTNTQCDKPNSDDEIGCTRTVLSWPDVTGSTKDAVAKVVLDKLRAEIAIKTHQYFVNGGFAKSPAEVPETFIREIDADREEYGMSYMSLYYERHIKVLFNDEYLFTIAEYEEGYTGGAHPNSYQTIHTFSLITGQTVSLDLIFLMDEMSALLKIAEKVFRKTLEIPEEEILNENGFWFPESKFYLSNNFFPSKEGITFVYNPYEVGPYALGQISIFLPYSDISKYISGWGPLKHHAPAEQ